MAPRAAWRLEALGFLDVYWYAAGKADWSAMGLPLEGDETPRIGAYAHRDVPTCSPHERLGAVRQRVEHAGWATCFVVVDRGVVVGRLDRRELSSGPDATAEEVMHTGPSTFRPDVSVHQMLHYMRDHELETAPVTTSDGRLIGLVLRDDLVSAEREDVEEAEAEERA